MQNLYINRQELPILEYRKSFLKNEKYWQIKTTKSRKSRLYYFKFSFPSSRFYPKAKIENSDYEDSEEFPRLNKSHK